MGKTDAERDVINARIYLHGRSGSLAKKLDMLMGLLERGLVDRSVLESFGQGQWSRGWDAAQRDMSND